MERHDFGLKIKAVGDEGTFTGLGAVYNNVDLGGDKILPGAFTRTLAAKKQLPMLWQHDATSPIGTVKVTDSPAGLQVEGQLELSDPTAQKAYRFLKSGVISGLSIGYDTVKAAFVDDVRELQELKLYEISVVTFPMNESASITGIKAMSQSDLLDHLKAINTHRKAIARHGRAMHEHMKSLLEPFYDDDTIADEELVTDGDYLDEASSKEFSIELQKMLALVKA